MHAIWASALILLISTSVQAEPWRVRSWAEIRQERVVIQKWDTSCGAAAMATLLTYDLGDPVSERVIASSMLHHSDPARLRTRGGFSLLNMQEFAEARGYIATGYGEMTLDDLVEFVPAIVPLQFHGYPHFVVVRQMRDGEVFFGDPAFGNRSLRITDFDLAWKEKLAFVVKRPG